MTDRSPTTLVLFHDNQMMLDFLNAGSDGAGPGAGLDGWGGVARYNVWKAHLEANSGVFLAQDDPEGLASWINKQRAAYEGSGRKPLSGDRIDLLEQLPGWTWEGRFKRPAETAPAPIVEDRSTKAPRSGANTSSEAIGDDDSSASDDGRDVDVAVDTAGWPDSDKIVIELDSDDG